MALVNTAVHLAQHNRRVLLVDFDLEAPGLDVFPLLRPKSHTPGVVEYVQSYIKENRAPDVSEFVAETSELSDVFIMPSGTWKTDYSSSFSQIDWQALYSERDGYLLLEDLKAQWEQTIQPDYVLVDSRTGYTDIGGICTRQLPNAVIAFFFPNEQNLRGLTKVVNDIRSEEHSPRKKTIELHFVMSNVPDLDDEDNVLLTMKERFQHELRFPEEPLIVHRYESLSLLNQKVFVKERPKSRLASEYVNVAKKIVEGNLADREGALRYIKNAKQPRHRLADPERYSPMKLLDSFKEIESLHQSDGEILYQLGTFAARERRLEDAKSLFTRSVDSRYRDPSVHLRRAEVLQDLEDFDGASKDAMVVLNNTDIELHEILGALRLVSKDQTETIATLPALKSLDPDYQIVLAGVLSHSGSMNFSNTILQYIEADDSCESTSRERACSQLVLNYIGTQEFQLATDILTKRYRDINNMNIRDAFNFGMAYWASAGSIDRVPFERVVSLDESPQVDDRNDANYFQCLALSNWVVGNSEQAFEFTKTALESAQNEHRMFSYWRYKTISTVQFKSDVEELLQMIQGDNSIRPRFMQNGQLDLFQ